MLRPAIRPTFGAFTALIWQEGGVLRGAHGRLKAVFVALIAAILLVGIPTPPPTFAADPPGLARFMIAIGRVESGGRYTARNARTGAYGKYQIIPSSWRAWARLYLGNANARKTPANQEKLAAAKFRAAYRWCGRSWRRVAYSWLTGSNRASGWSRFATSYVNKVMRYYAEARDPRPPAPKPTVAPTPTPTPTPTGAAPTSPADAAPPSPTDSAAASPSDAATANPTDTAPTPTPTDAASASPTDAPTASPTDTPPTPTPTDTAPTPTPTDTATPTTSAAPV